MRPDGGSLHASRFGGRVERRNAALAEAVERVEKGAVLTRAAVAREREAAKEALEQMEASIRAETSAELEKARDLIARSKSLGSKAVGFDEKVWATAPFAREVMRKFRVTLAVKRAFESLADDIAAEVAFEAIPEAARETRREIREAFKDMPDVLEKKLSPDESDGAESDGASSESGVSSSLSRSSFGDGGDGSHAGPASYLTTRTRARRTRASRARVSRRDASRFPAATQRMRVRTNELRFPSPRIRPDSSSRRRYVPRRSATPTTPTRRTRLRSTPSRTCPTCRRLP